jgi:hypothetical protein
MTHLVPKDQTGFKFSVLLANGGTHRTTYFGMLQGAPRGALNG